METVAQPEGNTTGLIARDPSTWQGTPLVSIPHRSYEQLLFSPGGSQLVLRGGKTLLVWDTPDLTGKPRKISNAKAHFTAVAFHPSGQYLAATSNDTTVKLYDTATWQVARTFTWNVGRLRSVAFSPDGMLAAVGSDTGKIVVWDVDL